MKALCRIAVAFTLAFIACFPLSFIVLRLGGTFGYTDLVNTMPFLLFGFWWLLGRHPYFRRANETRRLIPVTAGRNCWFYGTVGAVCAFVAYQLVYMLLLLLSIVVTVLVGAVIPERSGLDSAYRFACDVSTGVFFALWFVALSVGVKSGFRIGWHYGDGHPLSERLRSDYLFRLFACGNRALKRYRAWRDKTLKRESPAPPPSNPPARP